MALMALACALALTATGARGRRRQGWGLSSSMSMSARDATDSSYDDDGGAMGDDALGLDYVHESLVARRVTREGGVLAEEREDDDDELDSRLASSSSSSSSSNTSWSEDFTMLDPPPALVVSNMNGDGVHGSSTHPKWMREMWSAQTQALSASARLELETKLQGVPDALKHVKTGELLFVTFGTASVKDFVFNWVESTKKLKLEPIFVGALDEEMFQLCRSRNIPSMLLTGRSVLEARNTQFIAHGSESFKKMGTVKTKFVEDLLDIGVAPILSDADVVWMRDPRPVFNNGTYKYADILISTDCIDTEADRSDTGACNHVNFNTGIFHIRPTERAKAFVAAWKNLVTTSTIAWMRDQPAFNILTRDGGIHPAVDVPKHARGLAGYRSLVYVANATIRMGVLPNYQFSNGHTYFVQEHQKYHVEDGEPYAVHTTYQYGDSSSYAYGKRERLRQHGLWYVDPASYWSDGKFLTISAKGSQVQFDGDSAVGTDPDAYVTAITRHFEEDKIRRVTIRNALALAKALGRTLILPEARCYCDKIWNTLRGCRALGAETAHLPYACPMDHIYNLPAWFGALGVEFRHDGFLKDERVPETIRSDVVRVRVGVADNDDDSAHRTVNLEPGFDAKTAANALSAYADAAVIEFDRLDDGVFCGFGDPEADADFDSRASRALASEQYFCFEEAYIKQGKPNNGEPGHGEYQPQVVERHCGQPESSMSATSMTRGEVSHITREPIACSCEWAYASPRTLAQTTCRSSNN